MPPRKKTPVEFQNVVRDSDKGGNERKGLSSVRSPLNTVWKSPQGSYARWDIPFERTSRSPGWPPRLCQRSD